MFIKHLNHSFLNQSYIHNGHNFLKRDLGHFMFSINDAIHTILDTLKGTDKFIESCTCFIILLVCDLLILDQLIA